MTLYRIKPARVTKAGKPYAKPVARERPVQVALVEWLELVLPRGSVVAAVKNEHKARSKSKHGRIRFYQMRAAEGVKEGFPDLILALAHRTLYIETKAPQDKAAGFKGGVVDDDQLRIHDELRTLGHPVAVCTDIESARAFLLAEGVELREAAGQLARAAVVRMAPRRDGLNDSLPF